MEIRIIEEPIESLPEYGKISIGFWVRSKYLVGGTRHCPTLEERPVEPYFKDYDTDDPAESWPLRLDTSNWAVLAAFDGDERIGGAVVAWKTPEFGLLRDREDRIALWVIRVGPDHRHRGVGHRLFDSAVQWGRDRQCTEIVIETQDMNVPACRFYARQGCELRAANRDAYPKELSEIQLLWYRKLNI